MDIAGRLSCSPTNHLPGPALFENRYRKVKWREPTVFLRNQAKLGDDAKDEETPENEEDMDDETENESKRTDQPCKRDKR